jgi:hypothetical protein
LRSVQKSWQKKFFQVSAKNNFSGLCARRSLAIRSLFVSSAWDRGYTGGKLRLEFHTFNDVINDTYSESSHSPSHFIRTVAHDIPLRRAKWVDEDERVVVELPKSWFEFWISGIRAVSTFSKELVNLNLPGAVEEWQWNMLSFKTEWNLSLPVSSGLFRDAGLRGKE